MKKLLSFMLAFALALTMCIPASAAETSDGTVLVKTWENAAGETVTGVITKGTEVLKICNAPESANQARGIITRELEEAEAVTYSDDSGIATYATVSDVFYIQFYNSSGSVISKYKITLTGSATSSSQKITSVSISRVSGTVCTTDYDISGNTAYVIITHPTEGYIDANFVLTTDGEFLVY